MCVGIVFLVDSIEFVTLVDLQNEIQMIYPNCSWTYSNTKLNDFDKWLVSLKTIRRHVNNDLTIIEITIDECMKNAQIYRNKSNSYDRTSVEHIDLMEIQSKWNHCRQQLITIERYTVLLDRFDTSHHNNMHDEFLHIEFDRFYRLCVETYQMDLSIEINNVDMIRRQLNINRRTIRQQMKSLQTLHEKSTRKFNTIKTREKSKQHHYTTVQTLVMPFNETCRRVVIVFCHVQQSCHVKSTFLERKIEIITCVYSTSYNRACSSSS
jgi:hypothetical protein